MAMPAVPSIPEPLLAVVSLLVAAAVAVVFAWPKTRQSPVRKPPVRVPHAVLVTAHPDDECMFFTPTIAGLIEDGWEVSVLCLSTGGRDGEENATRSAELELVGEELGIHVLFADGADVRFPDGMDTTWRMQEIADVVQDFVEDSGVDAVITFDDYGVSGHGNHVAVSRGVDYFRRFRPCPANVDFYFLHSTSIWRKYSGPFDTFVSAMVCAPPDATYAVADWSLAARLMGLHASQNVWYRRLFTVFSRYVYINTLAYAQPTAVDEDGGVLDSDSELSSE